jgi:hypothetical protein
MCKCNCCKRGPQGIAGINSVVNVLTQDNVDVTFAIDDAGDETILLSNNNRLSYLSAVGGRYRVSLQFRLNNTAGISHTVYFSPTVAVGVQIFPLGTPLNYLSRSIAYTVPAGNNFYEVFEFDVFLAAGESIALSASTSGGVGDVTLRDNLFLIDKLS